MPTGPSQWLFDSWSRFYDLAPVQRAVYRPVQDAVVAALRSDPPARILDVGCGTGVLTARLRGELPGRAVIGLDFSAGMLAEAQAKSGALALVRGDGARLPFGDGAVDAIVATESFHWFPDPDAALREFRRVLRPAGRLLLAFVNPRFAVTGRVVHLASRLVRQPFSWPTAGALAERLTRAGFRIERQQRVLRFPGVLVFPPMLTVARRVDP